LPQQDPQDIGLLCPPRTNHRSLTESTRTTRGSNLRFPPQGEKVLARPGDLEARGSPRPFSLIPFPREVPRRFHCATQVSPPRFESPRREIFFSEYRRGTDESKSCARAGEREGNITATVPGIAIRASLPQESPSPSSSSRESPRGRGDERRNRPGEDRISSEKIREEVGLGQRAERV
jgi:hypothetical protein